MKPLYRAEIVVNNVSSVIRCEVFEALENTARDKGGEIQLTNGIRDLKAQRPVYGYRFEGTRHDAGNKLGFLKAVVYFALRRPDLAEKFSAYLNTIVRP